MNAPHGGAIACWKKKPRPTALFSTVADDPQVNAPHGGAIVCWKTKLRLTALFSTGADDPQVNAPHGGATASSGSRRGVAARLSAALQGGATEAWILHYVACRHTSVLVPMRGAVTKATAVTMDTAVTMAAVATMDTDTGFVR